MPKKEEAALQIQAKTRNEKLQEVFECVITWYLELNSIDGTRSIRSTDHYLLFSFPTICEFIADIEICFKEKLTEEEYTCLYLHYLAVDKLPVLMRYRKERGVEVVDAMLTKLKIKLAKTFKKKRIG